MERSRDVNCAVLRDDLKGLRDLFEDPINQIHHQFIPPVTILSYAVDFDAPSIYEACLRAPDPPLEALGPFNLTPLMQVCTGAAVAALVAAGARLETVNGKEGRTALFFAKNFEVVNALCDAGCNRMHADKRGMTALMRHVQWDGSIIGGEHLASIRMIVTASREELDACDENGHDAAWHAAEAWTTVDDLPSPLLKMIDGRRRALTRACGEGRVGERAYGKALAADDYEALQAAVRHDNPNLVPGRMLLHDAARAGASFIIATCVTQPGAVVCAEDATGLIAMMCASNMDTACLLSVCSDYEELTAIQRARGVIYAFRRAGQAPEAKKVAMLLFQNLIACNFIDYGDALPPHLAESLAEALACVYDEEPLRELLSEDDGYPFDPQRLLVAATASGNKYGIEVALEAGASTDDAACQEAVAGAM